MAAAPSAPKELHHQLAAPAPARLWHRSRRTAHTWSPCPRQACLAVLAQVLQHSRLHCTSVDPKNHAVQTCQAPTHQPNQPSSVWHTDAAQPPPGSGRQQQAAQRLTRLIKSCSTTSQLLSLLERHPPHLLNHIHVTALATRAAHLLADTYSQQAPPAVGEAPAGSAQVGHRRAAATPQQQQHSTWALLLQLLHLVDSHLPSLDARGVANVLWALASMANSLGLTQPDQHLQQLGFEEAAVSSSGQQAPAYELQPIEPSTRLNGQAVSHGTSSWDPNPASGAFTQQQQEPQQQQQQQDLAGLVQSMGSRLLHRAACLGWGRCNAQQLSNSLWAAATLGRQLPAGQGEQCLAAAAAQAQDLTPQGYASLMWSCAQLGLQPGPQLLSLAPRLLAGGEPQAFSNTLWAVAHLGLQPPQSWVHQVLALTRRCLHQFSSQALANTAWAVAHLQHVPEPGWLQALLAVCEQQLAHMAPRHVASLLWAVSTISEAAASADTSQGRQQPGHAGQQRHAQGQPAMCLASQPSQAWLSKVGSHIEHQLPHLQQQELSTVSHALANLGWLPSRSWLCTWQAAVGRLSASSSLLPQSLSCCAATAALWLQHQQQQQQHGESVPDSSATQQVQVLEALCLQLATSCHKQLQLQQQQQGQLSQQGGHVGLNGVNGHGSSHGLPAKALNGSAGWEQQPAPSPHPARGRQAAASERGQSVWLQLLTVLAASQGQPLSAWKAQGATQGLPALAKVAMRCALQRYTASDAPPPQQAISLCWALAKLGVRPRPAWQQQVVVPLVHACCQQLQQQHHRGASQLTAKEVSLLTWSCTQWGMGDACLPLAAAVQQLGAGQQAVTADAAAPTVAAAGLPDPSLVATSLVTLASHWRHTASHAAAASSRHPQPSSSSAASQQALAHNLLRQAAVLAAAGDAHGHALSARDLSRCLWAAARMGFRPSRQWGFAMQSRLVQLLQAGHGMCDLALCMWSLAKLQVVPPPLLAAQLLHAVLHGGEQQGCPLVDPQHPQRFLCVVSACKLWRVQPSPQWWQAVFAHPAWGACLAGLGQAPTLTQHGNPLHLPGSAAGGQALDGMAGAQLAGGAVEWGEEGFDKDSSMDDALQPTGQEQQQQQGMQQQQPAGVVAGGGWSVHDWRAVLRVLVALEVQPPDAWLHQLRQQVLQLLQPSICALAAQRQLRQQQRHAGQQMSLHQQQQQVAVADVSAHVLALSLQLLSGGEEQEVITGPGAAHSGPGAGAAAGPESGWLATAMCTAEACMPGMGLSSMCSVLFGCARFVGAHQLAAPLDNLATTVLMVSEPQLAAATSSQLLRLLRALAAVRAHPHPDWCHSLQLVLQPRLHLMSDAQLTALLPALADARCRLDRPFLTAYLQLVTPRLAQPVPFAPPPVPGARTSPSIAPAPASMAPAPSTPTAAAGPPAPAGPAAAGAASLEAGRQQLQLAPSPQLTPKPQQPAAAAPAAPEPAKLQRPGGAPAQQVDAMEQEGGVQAQGSLLQQPAHLAAMQAALYRLDPQLCVRWRRHVSVAYQL